MTVPLNKTAVRAASICFVLGVCTWLVYIVTCQFVVRAMTDERIPVAANAPTFSFITGPFSSDGLSAGAIAAALRYIPDSPSLHLKLADYERYRTDSNDVSVAELHAIQAIQLSPHDYRPRLLLSSIQQYEDDLPAAEKSAREAVRLAPQNSEAHFVLGTLLLYRKDMDSAAPEFRTAISGFPNYFDQAVNLVWKETGESAAAVQAMTPQDPKRRLALSRFLLNQSRVAESVSVFRQIDRAFLLRDRDSALYLNRLIALGEVSAAYELWRDVLDTENLEAARETTNAVWNGGFEKDILVDFAQFDWAIRANDYARISIDKGTAHSGNQSLRIEFLGHETTRLENEIRQVILLRGGARYQLSYNVKTENLSTSNGPRLVVATKDRNQWIASSEPEPQGSHDWQQRMVEFTAPGEVMVVGIQQRPKFSYEEPTRGTVWFDDFEIRQMQ